MRIGVTSQNFRTITGHAGKTRRFLVFESPEERIHLEALTAEAAGDRSLALSRWRELRAGRVPALAQAALRHLGEP